MSAASLQISLDDMWHTTSPCVIAARPAILMQIFYLRVRRARRRADQSRARTAPSPRSTERGRIEPRNWTNRVTMYDDSSIATPYWSRGSTRGTRPSTRPTPRYRFRFARAEDARRGLRRDPQRDEAMAPIVVHVRVPSHERAIASAAASTGKATSMAHVARVLARVRSVRYRQPALRVRACIKPGARRHPPTAGPDTDRHLPLLDDKSREHVEPFSSGTAESSGAISSIAMPPTSLPSSSCAIPVADPG